MSFKKILCLTLAVLMLLGVLVSCKKKTDTPTDTTPGSDSGSDTSDSLETDKYGQVVIGDTVPYDTLDYNGQEIYILSRSEHRYQREFGDLKEREDSVDEKIYARNMKVELDLNVKIKVVNDATTSEAMWGNERKDGALAAYVTALHTSGGAGADVIAAYAAYSTAGSIRDMYTNLMSATFGSGENTTQNYLRTDLAYWNQNYINAASLHNQLYYVVGDMNLGVYDKTIVTWVNNNLLGTLDQSKYSLDTLQETVLAGNWTQEMMKTMIRDFGHRDTDESGTQTNGDTYGMVAIKISEQYDGFCAAFGQVLTQKNAQGNLTYMIEDNVLSIQNALDAMRDLWSLPGSYAPSGVGPSFEIFYANRALFFTEILFRNESNFEKLSNQTTFTYSVLPLPKLDADLQDHYQTAPQDAYTVMSVMNCHSPEKLSMISAVLDLLTSRSYADVRPYYIENIVKARYVDDSNSVQILELIMDGVTFDAGIIFGQQLNSPVYGVWRNIAGGTTSVDAKWTSIGSGCNTKLADLNQWYISKLATG